jgi:hypothetical protein
MTMTTQVITWVSTWLCFAASERMRPALSTDVAPMRLVIRWLIHLTKTRQQERAADEQHDLQATAAKPVRYVADGSNFESHRIPSSHGGPAPLAGPS